MNRVVTEEVWPNFFIVGAARSGTTSMHEILRKVPGVYMSPFKEPEYFAPNAPTCRYGRHYSHVNNYLKLFKDAKNAAAIGESSTAYLWDPDAARSIHDRLPNAKIIVILRNPIERAYSDYLQDKHLRNIRIPFEEAIKIELKKRAESNDVDIEGFSYLRNGYYSHSLHHYFTLFGQDNVKVIIFEEFTRNSKDNVNQVLEFLGVRYRFSKPMEEKHNAFQVPRTTTLPSFVHTSKIMKFYHYLPFSLQSLIAKIYKSIEQSLLFKQGEKQVMSIQTRSTLRDIFSSDVKELEKLVARELPWVDFRN